MSADLKRLRDTAVEEAGSPASKKRAMSLDTPPPSEGDVGDEDSLEDWMKVVETKRKEAIYRQMIEYRRSYRSAHSRAEALEAQKRVLEASVQAVEICWTQLVNAVRDLTGAQTDVDKREALEPRLEVRCQHDELEKALESRLPVAQRMVKGFATLAQKNGLHPASSEDLQARCQQLEVDNHSLRSSEQLLRSQTTSLSDSNEKLQQDLDRSRKALNRQRMDHDREKLEWVENNVKPQDRGSGTPGAKANGSGAATPNGKLQEDVKPSIPGPSADVMVQDTSELEKVAASRLTELEALRQQHATLQQDHDRLLVEVSSPTEERLRASPFFQIYLHRLAFQQHRADEMEKRAELSEHKHDDIRETNGTFRDLLMSESRQELDALKQNLAKKEEEAARLRGQRDEFQAQLSERKAKEAEKIQFIDQVESLANSRQERINHLTSEVKRLKAKKGAEAGSEGYLAFLKTEGDVDGDYVKNLEDKLQVATAQLAGVQSEVNGDARLELEKARLALSKYERVLGADPTAAEDVRQLAERLEQSDKRCSSLQLQLTESDNATNALYTEIDGLSSLYEELDKKVKSKCFELKDGELKIQRLITEKAKADNKYFAAMRAKDGLDAENKTAQRTVDRQNKLLEKAQETDKSMREQLVAQEQAITKLKNAMTELHKQSTTSSSEKTTLEHQLQHVQKHLAEAKQIMHVRVADSAADRDARRKLEEEADVAAKTIKKLKERQDALVAAPSKDDMSASEWKMREERDKLLKLLRCSCCEQNFKQQVITKCMHTFCKTCLDSRVASRQRKCPACGVGFAKEDIQTLYWQ